MLLKPMKWFRLTPKQALAITLGILCTSSFAQSKDSFDYKVSNLTLLQDKIVQKEIGVTQTQRGKMNEAAGVHAQKLKSYIDRMREAKKEARVTDPIPMSYMEELKSKVISQLSASQLKRLRELSLQALGPSSLCDETVATKVKLSSTQLKAVRDIFTKSRKEYLEVGAKAEKSVLAPYQGKKPKDKTEEAKWQKAIQEGLAAAQKRISPTLDKIGTQAESKMVSQLTPAQKQTWNILLGKKFNFSGK